MAYSLRSIVKGTTIYTTGQLLIKASGFILIPIYTRYLTTDDYGIIGIVNVIVTVMVAALSMGTAQSQTRFYYEHKGDDSKVGQLLFSINVLLVVVGLGACTLLSFLGKPLFDAIVGGETVTFHPFVILAIWTAFFSLYGQIVTNYYITIKKYTYCSILLFLQFLVSVGLVIYFVVIEREGALGSVKGIFYGQLFYCAVFYWSYARRFSWRINTRYVRDVLALGLPITVVMTATAAQVSIDKLIVKSFLPLSSVGLYTLGYKFGFVMSVVVVSINRAWLPNYYELMNQSDESRAREVRRMFCVWVTMLGTLCVAGGVWADEIVVLMTAPAFYSAAAVVPMILLAFVFQGVYYFMVGPLYYFKRTAVMPVITVAGVAADIGLNFLLIPRYGIMGAAASALASFVVLAVLAYLLGRMYFNPHFELVRLGVLLVVASVLCVGGNSLGWHWPMEGLLAVAYLLLCFVLFPGYLRPLASAALRHVRSGMRSGGTKKR
jgi:O-antigen/teichoic acid export membrane protein